MIENVDSYLNKKYNMLTIIKRVDNYKDGSTMVECICDCGKVKDIMLSRVLSGNTKSCGCLKYSKNGLTQKDATHRKLWHMYRDMKRRCTDENSVRYKHYGARGIKVCDRWLEDYLNFYDDVTSTLGLPKKGDTIDRIDNNKGYSIENVKWSNMTEQAVNKRSRKDDTSMKNITQIGSKYRVKISRYGMIISSYLIEDLDRAKDLRDFYEYLFSGSKEECEQLYKEQCYLKK